MGIYIYIYLFIYYVIMYLCIYVFMMHIFCPDISFMLYIFNLSIYLCIYVLCTKLLYLAICVAHIVTMTHEVCSPQPPGRCRGGRQVSAEVEDAEWRWEGQEEGRGWNSGIMQMVSGEESSTKCCFWFGIDMHLHIVFFFQLKLPVKLPHFDEELAADSKGEVMIRWLWSSGNLLDIGYWVEYWERKGSQVGIQATEYGKHALLLNYTPSSWHRTRGLRLRSNIPYIWIFQTHGFPSISFAKPLVFCMVDFNVLHSGRQSRRSQESGRFEGWWRWRRCGGGVSVHD